MASTAKITAPQAEGANVPASCTPDAWARHHLGRADVDSDRGPWTAALLRRWKGTSPFLYQPPLDQHFIAQHLGGPKRIQRRRTGAHLSKVVELGSITIVAAGSGYLWHSDGPIEFAHLYLPPRLLERTAQRIGSRRPELQEVVGTLDPLLQSLFTAMLEEVSAGADADVIYLDSLLDSLLLTVLKDHTPGAERTSRKQERLTRAACRRIAEYVEEHLHEPLSLERLQALTDGSRYHFARAFRNAMGLPPHQYILRCRVARAQKLLTAGELRMDLIARRCGFRDSAHLSKTFSRIVGHTCTTYRRIQSR